MLSFPAASSPQKKGAIDYDEKQKHISKMARREDTQSMGR
jgi:hypothetical protein